MNDRRPAPTPEAAVDLSDFKLVDQADVYKGDDLAAHLTRNADGTVTFAYTNEWVRNAGDAVASTLRVTTEPVTAPGEACPRTLRTCFPRGADSPHCDRA